MAHPPWFPELALSGARYSAVELAKANDRVFLLDQRELPAREIYVELTGAEEVARAIRDMIVRGAPAIGVTAAYGMVLASRAACAEHPEGYLAAVHRAGEVLVASRPTAVNLAWAVKRTLAEAE